MKKISLPWFLCIIYIILGLTLPFLISLFAVRNRLDNVQPDQNIYINLREKESVDQVFKANHDFINIVILNLKNPGLVSKGDYLFSLKSEDGSLLSEKAFSGYNVGDPSSVRFQFDPIAVSKNKKFVFSVKSLTKENPGISVGANKDNQLNYSVYYRNLNKKAVAVDYLMNLVNILRSDFVFFTFWILLLFSLIWIKLLGIKKTK
jgi:hypothetical protein